MKNERIAKCLLCENDAELKHSEFPGYQEPELYKIYHCPICNTSFSFPMIETSKIYEHIYQNGKIVPGYKRYWRYMNKVKRTKNPLGFLSREEDTYWAVKEALSSLFIDKHSTKILEIGSGLGYLTYSLICANYDTVGIDISENAVQQAIKIFGDHYICANLFEFAQYHAESFDVVILTEVIEHVDMPLDFIESIKRLLKPSGRAIITTPNKSLYPSDIIWATDLPPVHFWWFSEESIKYIGRAKNLTIDFINFRKYYQKKPLTIDLRKIRNGQFEQATLNCNGLLVERLTKRGKNKLLMIRSSIYRIAFIRKMYNYLMQIVIKDKLVCKERGEILCTIMQKN
jgi:2-polyprenyl-3-methyl-5-hydroxy-6-metoxy-1,4-benzoquinol methylase